LTETNAEVKTKILKAIDKVKTDKFDILNYYEIKNLNKSLNG
jgi:Txe/YoeB family toxin of Txe-Axe toxin-antitoxin module